MTSKGISMTSQELTSKDNILKLLAKKSGICDEKVETFDLVYRGHSEIDRHYTKAMLPWIISEIKNQHKMLQVTVKIKEGYFEVAKKENSKFVLSHTIKQIHKCVMEQADHRCFLYTLRPPEKDSSIPESADSSTLVPCNINLNQNYQCHLYQALSEQEVRNFFYCLRQQPRDVKIQDNDTYNSLADLSVHTESQFFEVLFVGRVKVSHCKVPVTFIDEALIAFRQKEKSRLRCHSGETKERNSPNRMMSFQQDGSGYSVPNIVLRNVTPLPNWDANQEAPVSSKSSIRDTGSGEFLNKKDIEGRTSKVRFHLGESCDSEQGSPIHGLSPQSSLSSQSSQHLRDNLKEIDREDSWSSSYSMKHLLRRESDESVGRGPGSNEDLKMRIKKDTCVSMEESNSSYKVTIEPLHNRQRHTSSEDKNEDSSATNSGMRARAGSFGCMVPRQMSLKPGEYDLRGLGYDFNRTMLFHIGHREIQLINSELKSVQLHKPFKDIAGCCQGIKCNDHFGFICRELSGDSLVFVGYIFRCDKSSLADEIMQVLNRAFSAMHEAHQRDRKEHLMCDYCPLKWFSQLCADVEGLPATKAHTAIMRRVVTLPEEEREIIIAKYEGAETNDVVQKNNVLMMLLRTHFEYKQSSHSHPSQTNSQRSDFNLESSLKKARKSITTSFNQFLKREQRDSESAEKENTKSSEDHSVNPICVTTGERTPSTGGVTTTAADLNADSVLEGISDSPLRGPYRKRSSTFSGTDGDSIRKEILAKKAQASKTENTLSKEVITQQPSRPKMNMFLKFGGLSIDSNNIHDNDTESQSRPSTSFRHAILQTVVSPAKGLTVETPKSRKISCGRLDRFAIQDLRKRTIEELMIIWKKAVFQQILLNRIERANRRLRAIQKEAAMQRVRLNYESEELPLEALQTWELLLSKPQARIDSNVLFSGIKQGVPKSLRGEVWNLLTIQQQLFDQTLRQDLKKNKYPEHYNTQYEAILMELTSQQHSILIDLGRTFPSHPYFTQTLGPGQLALFNILKAYSILDQEVGYCQGLSFVGGVLLMHVEEELAYQLLKHLMYDKGCRKQYRPDLDGLQIRMYQLSRLVHDKLHSLYNHLEEHEVTPQLYAAPWFLTLFASQFPLNFVARVFDLLFLIGMEAVFCVALVLLKMHEQDLLALDSFEQIMDHFKVSVPSIPNHQLSYFFTSVCDCNVSKELSAYEVEFQVLQEELSLSPQQDADIKKLRESTKNLKRQNLDLLEQIQKTSIRQQALETKNQSLQQNQHHLEVRVRWLEIERNNMRSLIRILSDNATEETFEKIPSNLERYLPHKASSPMPEDRIYVSHPEQSESKQKCSSPFRDLGSPPREISISVPRQHSFSPKRSLRFEEQPEERGAVAPPTQISAPSKSLKKSPSPEPFLTVEPIQRKRSTTLDPKAMQNYFRSFIRAD